MSKTLGAILTVGAAVGLAVIGAPQISAWLLSAGLPIGTAVGVGSAIVTGAIAAGATAGLQLAGSVLAGRPAQRPDTTEYTHKSPIPPRVRAYGKLRLYGSSILFSHKSDSTPVDVWAFHDGQANAITQVYLNDDKVTRSGDYVQPLGDQRYRDNKLRAGYTLGLPTETAHATVLAELPGIWTPDHRGDGVVTGYLVKYLTSTAKFTETYPTGDDIQMSLAGEWSLVFDPRDPTQDAYTPSTWKYRDNAILAFVHYQITQNGKDWDTQFVPHLAKLMAAINDCDAAMALAAGGTEPRYRVAMAYKAVEPPSSVIAAIMACCDGWYCENERGEIIVYSGRFYEPTVSIGPAQIVSYSFQQHVAAEDALNQVPISYVSAEHDFATIDAPAWRNEDAIAASGREPVSAPLQAQMPSPSQGGRLAKRKMYRANAPCRGTVVTTYTGRPVLGERYINLRIEEAGALFYDGAAEIVGSPELDMQTGGVRFDWIAIGPEIDDWSTAEEGGAAPVGEVPGLDPFLPSPLTGLSVAANADATLIAIDYDDSDHAERYLVELIVEP